MTVNPSISIVTACYNSVPFLHRLHTSLCRQTYTNFEWITVDDRSKDATVHLLTSIDSPGDGGMRTFALPQNSGGGVAAGFGVEKAAGDILLLVDHDDELEDFALQTIADEWSHISSRQEFSGIFLRRMNPSNNEVIGGLLDEGIDFTMSWLTNSKPSISDGVIAMRKEIAIKYLNARSLEPICLLGVPLNQMTHQNRLRSGSQRPIYRYHRDNPESQTNSVKVSRKTVYTYAKYIDLWDRYYFLRPLHWLRHTLALIRFSIAVHSVPWYHHRYINSPSIRLLSWLLMPLALLSYVALPSVTVINIQNFDFSALASLPDLRSTISS